MTSASGEPLAPATDAPRINVGVLGARGRMGTEVVKAVNEADDLELVAMVASGDWLFDVANAGAQVVVDFTRPDVVMENIRFCIDQNIHCVVGTTGFDEARLATIAEWLRPKPEIGVLIAPNFGIGAVLLIGHAAGSEVVQGLTPLARSASVADWLADVAGLVAGLVLWDVLSRRSRVARRAATLRRRRPPGSLTA